MYVLFLVPCALHEGYSGSVGLGLHMHARLLIRLNLAGCGHSVVLIEVKVKATQAASSIDNLLHVLHMNTS
jgi:hypothetical protein